MHEPPAPTLPPIGCNGRGVQRSSLHRPVGLQELAIRDQFRLVHETGVFDCFDRLPLRPQLAEYEAAIAEFGLPVHTASWFYRLGEDEDLLADNLRICQAIGARCHNIMTFKHHRDGHVLDDAEITDHYLRVYDDAMALGVEPSFELHVNMWTEDFLRVRSVARQVQARGVPFHFTLDYSHVNFKIGNPAEQELSGVRERVERGELALDPFEPGSLCAQWLDMGIVRWAQLRAAGPHQPMNLWHRNEDGSHGRGIQYPMLRPGPGEWHSPWHAYLLEPSKEVIRQVLAYHHAHAHSPLRYLTTEFINLPDYGMGARYDLLAQNVAAARFMRQTWDEICARHTARPSCEGAA